MFASRIRAKAMALSFGVHWVYPGLSFVRLLVHIQKELGFYCKFTWKVEVLLCSFSDNYLQVSNFIIGLLFLAVVEKVGVSVVYLGFGAVCALGTFYVSNNVVETKGRSLEEIERELSPIV